MMPRLRLVLTTATLAVLGLSAGSRARDESSVYRDDRYGFSIEPPAFEDDGEAASVTIAYFLAPALEGFAANVNIQRQVLSGELKDYVAMSESQFESLELEIESSKPKQVGKRAAHEWVYAGDVGGNSLKFRALAVADGEHVVLVTCTAAAKHFDDYAKQFDESLASLEFDD